MRSEALQINRFYQTAQGEAARAMMLRRLVTLWPDLKDLDVLSIGYGPPVLDGLGKSSRRCLAFMPAEQGAIRWPAETASQTVLGEDTHLPFMDTLFDRVVLVHALEESHAPHHLLREVWRIMAPQGRLVLIAPNRSGLWARMDSTPFGHGRPFSKSQLSQLLTNAAFEPTAWARALYAPPWPWACKKNRAIGWETFGEQFLPRLGGLIMVEAIKQTAALTPRKARRVRVRLPTLEGAPTPALSPRSTQREEETYEP